MSFLILFSPDISKDSIIKIFCCLSISSTCRTSPKHKMRESSPDMVIENRNEQFFIKFMPAILIMFSRKIFPPKIPPKLNLTQQEKHFAYQHEETICISPVKWGKQRENYFHMNSPLMMSTKPIICWTCDKCERSLKEYSNLLLKIW